MRTIACKAPLSLGFSRHEHWSGLPCLPPGDLPDLGIEPADRTCVSYVYLHWRVGSVLEPLGEPSRLYSKCKGPEVGECLWGQWAGAEQVRGR